MTLYRMTFPAANTIACARQMMWSGISQYECTPTSTEPLYPKKTVADHGIGRESPTEASTASSPDGGGADDAGYDCRWARFDLHVYDTWRKLGCIRRR